MPVRHLDKENLVDIKRQHFFFTENRRYLLTSSNTNQHKAIAELAGFLRDNKIRAHYNCIALGANIRIGFLLDK